jgi:hypothetical protein
MNYTWSDYSKGNYAQWDIINGRSFARTEVFIPDTNATTQNAQYEIKGMYVNSLSGLNQSIYNNQWVRLTQNSYNNTGNFYGADYIELSDDTNENWKKVGFDEIRITYF